MILRHDPARLPEPPPASHLDSLRVAAEIARPAVRLVVVAAAVLLVAMMYRIGASAEPDAARAWGLALSAIALLGLVELLPRSHRTGARRTGARRSGAVLEPPADRSPWSDRAIIASARRWAGAATVLAMASLALLVATTAAGAAMSALQFSLAIGGLLAARALLFFAPARRASCTADGGLARASTRPDVTPPAAAPRMR